MNSVVTDLLEQHMKEQYGEEYLQLLSSFRRDILFENTRWTRQLLTDGAKDVRFPEQKRRLAIEDLVEHFAQKPKRTKKKTLGTLGVWSTVERMSRFLCIDCDTVAATQQARDLLMPAFADYGCEPIYEHSGNGRCHVFVLVELIAAERLHKFVLLVFHKKGLNPSDFELYGCSRTGNIRLPGGYHLRFQTVFPIEFRGECSSDPAFIMQSFLKSKRLSKEVIESVLHSSLETRSPEPTTTQHSQLRFCDKRLPVTLEAPQPIRKVLRNCQAYNRIITQGYLNDDTGKGHNAGLAIGGLAQFHDSRAMKQDHSDLSEGVAWATKVFASQRDRKWEQHNWLQKSGPKVIPTCKTMEDWFGLCNGCSFRGRLDCYGPIQIYYGKPVQRNWVPFSEVRLRTAKEVREDTFPKVGKRIDSLLEYYHNEQK